MRKEQRCSPLHVDLGPIQVAREGTTASVLTGEDPPVPGEEGSPNREVAVRAVG